MILSARVLCTCIRVFFTITMDILSVLLTRLSDMYVATNDYFLLVVDHSWLIAKN